MFKFRKSGILGINARNLLYIRPYNPKKAIKLADNKIKTKQFLSTRGIPVPRLYGIIRTPQDIEKFDFGTLANTFVVKPNHGFGGEGIIPVTSKRDGLWITAGGKQIDLNEMKNHIRDIIDGRFSISNLRDEAFFEQYIVCDDQIAKYSYEGLPDIRVVVHNLIPVMAMLRLPTKESAGKANLHLGAVGVGIDIAKGEATHIAYRNAIIDELPNGLGKIQGTKIPYWDDILHIASQVQLITNLGYMAIDIGLDRTQGPVLLEINARAGLGVQIANLAPLRKRLERIEGIKVTTPKKGVRVAKDMFGNTVEKEIKSLSGKEIISTEEEVELIQKQDTVRAQAKIDTGQVRTAIDEEFAEKSGLLEDLENFDSEKSTLKIKFNLKGKRIQTVIDVEKFTKKDHQIIVGSRDLQGFLVDPSRTNQDKQRKALGKAAPKSEKAEQKSNYRLIDQKLIQIDNKIKLLYHLKPTNLESERAKFMENTTYNPQFEYPALKFDPLELTSELAKINIDNSPLGRLFNKKKTRISQKIQLLEAIDEERFTKLSEKIYGKPSEQDYQKALAKIKQVDIVASRRNEKSISAEEAKHQFEKAFAKYGLKNWKVKLKDSMVADCVAGKNNRLFVRKDAQFSKERIESLIVHEIETHIITAENGKMQIYELFNRGLADYLVTQEGLAMYNVETQRKTKFAENYKAMAHVISIATAIKHSFADTYRTLLELGIPSRQAFKSALKAKRGLADTSKPGAFTKDYVYFKGYYQVAKFVEEGGNLQDLYIGKFNLEDLENIKAIPAIASPKILPKWLK